MHILSARSAGSWSALILALVTATLGAENIPVRHPQGAAHGFLELKTSEGKLLAIGDMTQAVQGDRITSRLTFQP